jgi:hypothetical protein
MRFPVKVLATFGLPLVQRKPATLGAADSVASLYRPPKRTQSGGPAIEAGLGTCYFDGSRSVKSTAVMPLISRGRLTSLPHDWRATPQSFGEVSTTRSLF